MKLVLYNPLQSGPWGECVVSKFWQAFLRLGEVVLSGCEIKNRNDDPPNFLGVFILFCF